jgi:hypothetical protein
MLRSTFFSPIINTWFAANCNTFFVAEPQWKTSMNLANHSSPPGSNLMEKNQGKEYDQDFILQNCGSAEDCTVIGCFCLYQSSS